MAKAVRAKKKAEIKPPTMMDLYPGVSFIALPTVGTPEMENLAREWVDRENGILAAHGQESPLISGRTYATTGRYPFLPIAVPPHVRYKIPQMVEVPVALTFFQRLLRRFAWL